MNLTKNQAVKIYLIVGHRGTGKTSWLKKLKSIFIKSSLKDWNLIEKEGGMIITWGGSSFSREGQNPTKTGF